MGAGDAIELIHRDANNVTVADIVRLYVSDKGNLDLLHRAVQVEALPASWRDYFRSRIDKFAKS